MENSVVNFIQLQVQTMIATPITSFISSQELQISDHGA